MDVIDIALKEDIGSGDITTSLLISADKKVEAVIKAKDDGIIAGLEIAKQVFVRLDSSIYWKENFKDGGRIKSGDIVAEIKGSHRAILTGERTALNFLQRMSGIATETSKFVEAVKESGSRRTKILDSRKTAPGLRELDKYSVKMGGGVNHRMGLYDMVLIKDNHIQIAGGIKNAVKQIRTNLKEGIKIEVETKNLEEVKQALVSKVDWIMLDNMSTEMMKEAVDLIDGHALVEASGNVSLDRVREIAETGVDFISVGALTHSVKALDIALYIKENVPARSQSR
jgi:nicotinate-nucleotide pyrophosphorylase (carboxylating)